MEQHSPFLKLGPLKVLRGCRIRTLQCHGFQLPQHGRWAEHLSHTAVPREPPTGEHGQDSGSRYLFNVSDFQLFAGTKRFMATSLVHMPMMSPREERQSTYIAVTVPGWTEEAVLKPLSPFSTAFDSLCLPPGI